MRRICGNNKMELVSSKTGLHFAIPTYCRRRNVVIYLRRNKGKRGKWERRKKRDNADKQLYRSETARDEMERLLA